LTYILCPGAASRSTGRQVLAGDLAPTESSRNARRGRGDLIVNAATLELL
jgi:hypothetical protein